jgi:hypothetical protein
MGFVADRIYSIVNLNLNSSPCRVPNSGKSFLLLPFRMLWCRPNAVLRRDTDKKYGKKIPNAGQSTAPSAFGCVVTITY